MQSQNKPKCPQCHQSAPVRLRGLSAFCTACGAERSAFNTHSLDFAGKPQRWGGMAARVAGWVGLGIGTLASATVGGLIALLGQWLAEFPTPGYVIGGLMWALTLIMSVTAIIGGRWLGQRGSEKQRATHHAALRALAQHQQGYVTAPVAARALDIPVAQADDMLTELARNPEENIFVDLDDSGQLVYLFGSQGYEADPRWLRIEQEQRGQRVSTDDSAAEHAELAADSTGARKHHT